ncbi:hypothetical protein LO80_03170 [Candidatus Francisella endociliophora]|uniref:Tape measure protein N-terminal domain-containing protein n=1 Tax=Candidatus Francisella endociliophora TaxID=653937 RepID=A0A097END0_9GAMM|nr:tape measure protein [Francisella sp. FSC1006]AIT09071.1 hypothetical protein LO80_03170 [Francisella sp. FSC1006]
MKEPIYIEIKQDGGDVVAKKISDIGKAAGSTDKRIQSLQKENRKLSDKNKELSTSLADLEKRFKTGAGGANLLKTAFAAIGGTLLIHKLFEYSDSLQNMENKLKVVTSSSEELKAVQEELFNVANRSRSSIGSVVDLYSRMARSTKALGYSQEETLQLTETISKGLQISGASAQESASAVLQLGQAFASGALRGEEFNAVNEASPIIMEALARSIAGVGASSEEINVVRGNLKDMASQGQLTAELVAKAMQEQAGWIESEYAKMETTVGQALTLIQNNFLHAFKDFDDASHISDILATSLEFVANNLSTVLKMVTILGSAMVLNFGGKALYAVTGLSNGIKGLFTVIGKNPIFLLITGLTSLYFIIESVINSKDELNEASKKEIANNKALISTYTTLNKVEKENAKIDLTKKIEDQKKALEDLKKQQIEAQNEAKKLEDRAKSLQSGFNTPGQSFFNKKFSGDVSGLTKIDDEILNAQKRLESFETTLRTLEAKDKHEVKIKATVQSELIEKQYADLVSGLEKNIAISQAKAAGDTFKEYLLKNNIDTANFTDEQIDIIRKRFNELESFNDKNISVDNPLGKFDFKEFADGLGIYNSELEKTLSNFDVINSKTKDLTAEQKQLLIANEKIKAFKSIGIQNPEALLDATDKLALQRQEMERYEAVAKKTGKTVEELKQAVESNKDGYDTLSASISNFDVSALQSLGYTQLLTDSVNNFGNSITNSLVDVLTGAKSPMEGFLNLIQKMALDIGTLIIKMYTFKAITESIKAFQGGGIGGLFGMFGFADGGQVPVIKYADGGLAVGNSHANGGIKGIVAGQTPIEFEGGEFIVNKDSTAKYLPLLNQINTNSLKFADGGKLPQAPVNTIVSPVTSPRQSNNSDSSNTNKIQNNIKFVVVSNQQEAILEATNEPDFEARIFNIMQRKNEYIT